VEEFRLSEEVRGVACGVNRICDYVFVCFDPGEVKVKVQVKILRDDATCRDAPSQAKCHCKATKLLDGLGTRIRKDITRGT
jgi:hypothetical protein